MKLLIISSFNHQKKVTMKTKIQLFTIQKVIERRKERQYSQRKLADVMNVSHSFIQQVEDPCTDTAYNLGHLNAIAYLLKCSVRDFLPEKPFAVKPKEKKR